MSKSVFGYDDAADVLEPVSTTNIDTISFYRMNQVYGGVPVYGRQMIVYANGDGEVAGVDGNYLNLDGIDVSPDVTEDHAKAAAVSFFETTYGVDAQTIAVSEPTLTIYTYAQNPALCWELTARCGRVISDTVFIDAQTGELIATYSNAMEVKATGQDGFMTCRYRPRPVRLLTAHGIYTSTTASTDRQRATAGLRWMPWATSYQPMTSTAMCSAENSTTATGIPA
ncbi:MAG: hypothetical protein LBK67_12945 [Coriobacteriales bacterium]|jgi:Zn-dependent metalloprotease|nr:hypothetical protein [Coriobacteriales bacterium]